MVSKKILNNWILISGIIISVISVVHNYFGFGMYKQMVMDETMKKFACGFFYMFELGGTSFLYAALLMLYSLKGLKKFEKWGWILSFSSACFIALMQIGALTIGKFNNPLIYIVAICSISSILVLVLNLKNFKTKIN